MTFRNHPAIEIAATKARNRPSPVRNVGAARRVALLGPGILGLGILGLGLLTPAFAQSPEPVPPPAGPVTPLAGVKLGWDRFSGTFDQAQVENARILYNNELSVRADTLQGNLIRQQYLASGNVAVHEADTTLTAHTLQFDGAQNQGVAQETVLSQPMVTVRARRIDIDAATLHAQNARVYNAPPDVSPDFEARAGTLDLYPKENRGVLRQASLYLFRTRLITLRHVPFRYGHGAGGQRQVVLPSLGVSSRYGTFLTFGGTVSGQFPVHYRLLLPTRQAPQVRLTAQQTLLSRPVPTAPVSPEAQNVRRDYLGAFRRLATAARPPLPPGDPLLFHNFLPEPSAIRPLDDPPAGRVILQEEVSSHIEARGRRLDNVYVSRLPEIAVAAQLPLNAVPPPTPAGDAGAFRQSLRRLVLLATGEASTGYYEEQPLNRRAARQRVGVGLTTRPLLVAPNTLFVPRVQMVVNYYSGQRSTYRYVQAGAEIAHDFSPYSGVGLGILAATTHGESPFNFDVLDTTREFDGRVQVGNRRLSLAALFRYDLERHEVIDYKLAVAPGLRGVTPVISYNFRSRSVGLGLDITGLPF